MQQLQIALLVCLFKGNYLCRALHKSLNYFHLLLLMFIQPIHFKLGYFLSLFFKKLPCAK